MAEKLHRPLYSVSEISEIPPRSDLKDICRSTWCPARRARGAALRQPSPSHPWRAMLLLDEADVHLERRSTMDVLRNGLVSAFLRSLEHCRRISFLTTNRVHDWRINYDLCHGAEPFDRLGFQWWRHVNKGFIAAGLLTNFIAAGLLTNFIAALLTILDASEQSLLQPMFVRALSGPGLRSSGLYYRSRGRSGGSEPQTPGSIA
jgi:hypothetical protein